MPQNEEEGWNENSDDMRCGDVCREGELSLSALAIKNGKAVQDVDYKALRARLVADV